VRTTLTCTQDGNTTIFKSWSVAVKINRAMVRAVEGLRMRKWLDGLLTA
jgi:hypothetical protein